MAPLDFLTGSSLWLSFWVPQPLYISFYPQQGMRNCHYNKNPHHWRGQVTTHLNLIFSSIVSETGCQFVTRHFLEYLAMCSSRGNKWQVKDIISTQVQLGDLVSLLGRLTGILTNYLQQHGRLINKDITGSLAYQGWVHGSCIILVMFSINLPSPIDWSPSKTTCSWAIGTE